LTHSDTYRSLGREDISEDEKKRKEIGGEAEVFGQTTGNKPSKANKSQSAFNVLLGSEETRINRGPKKDGKDEGQRIAVRSTIDKKVTNELTSEERIEREPRWRFMIKSPSV
jgi:hypothetical protein